MAHFYRYYYNEHNKEHKRKWWERLLGLNRPRYEYSIFNLGTFTIYKEE
jgi:hypothetical protein